MKFMNATLSKNGKIFYQYVRMHVAHLLEYRINFFFDIIVRFLEFAVFFFMWQSILGKNASIPGWDLQGLVVLYAFQNIFLALLITFAFGAMNAWEKIMSGELDRFLARPTIPWFMLAVENMELAFGGWFLGIGYFAVAFMFFGFTLSLPVALVLILMVVLAVGIALFFGLAMSSLSFWLGRLESIWGIWEGLFEFDQYPQTIFPWPIQTITSFTFPYLFANTLPALALLQKISFEQLVPWILVEAGVLAVNYLVFSFLWKRGVKRYESYGG